MALELVNDSEGWRIEPSPGDTSLPGGDLHPETVFDLCNAGMEMLTELLPQLNGFSDNTYSVEGCRISGAGATFIWRFGALLTADEATHRQAPQLPLATPSERAAIPAS